MRLVWYGKIENDQDHPDESKFVKRTIKHVFFLEMIGIMLISQPFAKGKGWYAIVKREIQYDFFLQMIWIIRMSRPFAIRTSQSAIYCK